MKSSDVRDAALVVAILVATLIGLVGIGVFGWQCILWVRDGVWTSYDYRDVWTYFGGGDLAFEPRWLRAIGNLILDAPIFSSAIAAAAAASKIIPDFREKRRSARKRKPSPRKTPARKRAAG